MTVSNISWMSCAVDNSVASSWNAVVCHQCFFTCLTGWWYTYPSENISSSVRMIIPNWMEIHEIHVPNHQPDRIFHYNHYKPTNFGESPWLWKPSMAKDGALSPLDCLLFCRQIQDPTSTVYRSPKSRPWNPLPRRDGHRWPIRSSYVCCLNNF